MTADVLVACEYSATVRDAFLRAGIKAVSCDLLPTESEEWPGDRYPELHHTGDVFDFLTEGSWRLMVAHPPCTYLTGAGAKHLYELDGNSTVKDDNGHPIPNPYRWADLVDGARFFRALWEADVPRIAVENPVMMGYAKALIFGDANRSPEQTFQPYQFGHMETKRTCLWLKDLPPLVPTTDLKAETMALPYAQRAKVHSMAPSPDRGKLRSMFFTGVADAMAAQWGQLL